MQSLPRSSETVEQRPISERTLSQRRRSAETNEQTAARLSARRDCDSQRRRSGDYFKVEGSTGVTLPNTSDVVEPFRRIAPERLVCHKTQFATTASK